MSMAGHQRTRAPKSSRSEPLNMRAATTAMNVGANSPNMADGLLPVGVSAAADNDRYNRRYIEPDTHVQRGAFPPVLKESHCSFNSLVQGIPSIQESAEPVPEKFPSTTHLFRFL